MESNLSEEVKPQKKAQIIIHKFKSCNSTHSSVSADSASTNTASILSNNALANLPPLSSLNLDRLPSNVKFELDQLELELLEGDITQKGYDKKIAKLIEPYLSILVSSKEESMQKNVSRTSAQIVSKASDLNKSKEKIRIPKKNKNREDPNANRYHSEIRQEAVKAALAMYSNQKQSCIVASKRTTGYMTPQQITQKESNMDTKQQFSDSSEEENGKLDLIEYPASNCSTNDSYANKSNLKREYFGNQASEFITPKLNDILTVNSTGTSSCSASTGSASNTSSNLSIPNETNKINNCHINQLYFHVQDLKSTKQNSNKINYSTPFQKTDRVVAIKTSNQVNSKNLTKLHAQNQQIKIIQTSNQKNIDATNKEHQQDTSGSKSASSGQLNQSTSSENDSLEIRVTSRVSAKIQQLLNTLKRPKRRPLNEYFEDNQEEID
ncbi:disco-interacting 2 -like protein, partial [Brachionus plicatilis]